MGLQAGVAAVGEGGTENAGEWAPIMVMAALEKQREIDLRCILDGRGMTSGPDASKSGWRETSRGKSVHTKIR